MVQTAENPVTISAQPTERERRRLGMLEVMGTRSALSALETIACDLPEQERQVASAKLAVQLAKEVLDLREAELTYQAQGNGKNAEERKALTEAAKGADEEYQQRKALLREAEEQLADAERDASVLRKRERYWHAFISLRTAQINYITSGE